MRAQVRWRARLEELAARAERGCRGIAEHDDLRTDPNPERRARDFGYVTSESGRFERWLRRNGNKWNEKRGMRRAAATACWAVWKLVYLLRHPMARGRRLRVLLIAYRFEVQRRLFSREFTATLPRGATLICPPWTGSSRELLCFGIVDFEEQTFLLDTLGPGDVAVDVGAFLGTYTVLMAACGATGHAFEPTERVCDVLTRSIDANGFAQPVTVNPIALSDFTGRASFTTDFDSGNRLAGGNATDVRATSEVAVDTLDHWADLHDLSGLFVIKIDAEGADESVLLGAAAVLKKFDPVVIVEYWDDAGALQALLRSQGYEACRYVPEERRLVARSDAAGTDGNLVACSAERLKDVQRRLAEPPRVL